MAQGRQGRRQEIAKEKERANQIHTLMESAQAINGIMRNMSKILRQEEKQETSLRKSLPRSRPPPGGRQKNHARGPSNPAVNATTTPAVNAQNGPGAPVIATTGAATALATPPVRGEQAPQSALSDPRVAGKRARQDDSEPLSSL